MDLKLSFYGAAKNVTGSKYLLKADGAQVLIDCGYYQERKLQQRNWDPFPFDPAAVDSVVLTHAHLDHCGLLPKLVRDGFEGKIYCTDAARDIAKIILQDSARIQEEDVKYKMKRHAKQGKESPHPYEPLYTVEDAERVFPHFRSVDYGTTTEVAPGVQCTLRDAGHILGSAILQFDVGTGDDARRILFSGDVGRSNSPILEDPDTFERADYVVMESTYGNRVHKPTEGIPDALARIINQTARAGGNLCIPSFSVERAQELLYHLHNLLKAKRIPKLPVFLDSPMAIKVTEVFRNHPELFDEETQAMIRRGEHPCDFPGLTLCRTVDESKAIKGTKGPCIIIAGSGMCTGGRIKHHIKNNVGRRESTILFVGYQASGTLGRILLEGADPIRLFGEEYAVEARIEKINGFSAHADRRELFAWLSAIKEAPRCVFITHGEEDAANEFAEYVTLRSKGWKTRVPDYLDTVDLD